MKKKLLAGIAAGIFLFCSYGSAGATLISQGSTYGLDTITFDTTTGLAWLDLTVTQNLSAAYVETQLGVGGLYNGFRFASALEVNDLVMIAGLTVGSNQGTAQIAAAQELINLMGATSFQNSYPQALGFTADTGGDMRAVGNLDFYWSNGIATYDAGVTGLWWNENIAFASGGSWLVTEAPVPEPATMLLFGTGLAGLAGIRLRKKKH